LNESRRRVEAQGADCARQRERVGDVSRDEIGPRREIGGERPAPDFDIEGQQRKRRAQWGREQKRDRKVPFERKMRERIEPFGRIGDEEQVRGPGRQMETAPARANEVEFVARLQRRVRMRRANKKLKPARVRMSQVERDAEQGLRGDAGRRFALAGEVELSGRRQCLGAAAPDVDLSTRCRNFDNPQRERPHVAMVS
jgi:hypothetical protein